MSPGGDADATRALCLFWGSTGWVTEKDRINTDTLTNPIVYTIAGIADPLENPAGTGGYKIQPFFLSSNFVRTGPCRVPFLLQNALQRAECAVLVALLRRYAEGETGFSQFRHPAGIDVVGTETYSVMYVVDSLDHRVRRIYRDDYRRCEP